MCSGLSREAEAAPFPPPPPPPPPSLFFSSLSFLLSTLSSLLPHSEITVRYIVRMGLRMGCGTAEPGICRAGWKLRQALLLHVGIESYPEDTPDCSSCLQLTGSSPSTACHLLHAASEFVFGSVTRCDNVASQHTKVITLEARRVSERTLDR